MADNGAPTEGLQNLNVADTPVKAGAEDHKAKAREAGWTETTAFDYEQFQRLGGDDADWHGAAGKYEWDDEYGDVAPRVEQLENILFGGEFQMRKGDHIEALELEVALEGPVKVKRTLSFEDAGIHPAILENIKLARYDRPTVIQQYTIPAVLQGYDVVAVAQTGSGKTAAYMIPVLSKLMGKATKLRAPRPRPGEVGRSYRAEPLVVIVVPTRELAMQIFDEARRMCYRSMLRPCVAYGGLPMNICLEELGKGCDLLVATPGRLCDLMDKPHALSMTRVKYTIIDEADEMLESDWEESLHKIMAGGDTNEDADHVYMMFSATFPKGAREMARNFMADEHAYIRVGRAGQAHKNIRQEVILATRDNKQTAVYDLLFSMSPARTLIFCNSKMTVDLLDDFLFNRDLPTTSIHADRNQREREDAIRAFRTGKAPILIATGVSARGLDIKDIKHVINFDLPSADHGGIQEYVHRIGRTARIGHQGLATSLYDEERDESLGQALVNILVECDCTVPEFLQQFAPEDGKLIFDDDTDDEAEQDADGADAGGWGGADTVAATGGMGGWGADAPATGAPAANAWGGPAPIDSSDPWDPSK